MLQGRNRSTVPADVAIPVASMAVSGGKSTKLTRVKLIKPGSVKTLVQVTVTFCPLVKWAPPAGEVSRMAEVSGAMRARKDRRKRILDGGYKDECRSARVQE